MAEELSVKYNETEFYADLSNACPSVWNNDILHVAENDTKEACLIHLDLD